MLEIVIEEVLWSIRGSYQTIWSFLSQMLNDILWPDHIQWQPPTDQTLYRTRPFTEFWVVSIEHLRRVWHADRGRLLLRTPGPVPLGLAYVLLVETNPFPNLSLLYRTMLFEYPSVLSRFCFILHEVCYYTQTHECRYRILLIHSSTLLNCHQLNVYRRFLTRNNQMTWDEME